MDADTTLQMQSSKESECLAHLISFQEHVVLFWNNQRNNLHLGAYVFASIAVASYLSYALYLDLQGSIPLIVFSAIFIVLSSGFLVKWTWGDMIKFRYLQPSQVQVSKIWNKWGRWYVL